MRALKKSVTVNYVKGPEVPIANPLSRVSFQLAPSNGQHPKICVHHITQSLPSSPTKPGLKIIFEWWPVMLTSQTNFSSIMSRF